MELWWFLRDGEMIDFARSIGSAPWLLPHKEEDWSLGPFSHVRTSNEEEKDKAYEGKTIKEILELSGAQKSVKFLEDYYENNEFLLKKQEDEEVAPVFKPPYVEKLYSIYGKNLETEYSYYFKDKHDHITLDSKAENYVKDLDERLSLHSDGICYEVPTDSHPSGDGTVPYESLSYGKIWEEEYKDRIIKNIEIDGAEHRCILKDEGFLTQLIQLVGEDNCIIKPESEKEQKNKSSKHKHKHSHKSSKHKHKHSHKKKDNNEEETKKKNNNEEEKSKNEVTK
eukprot:TRINITY_DN4287_c0_g3_i1.p1 TRINITY_DN4287_c0_g3~~TRINITY_DN4287_c0_g3_i1.p1  ORF type:complete len:282 (+),score=118.25 TRINITY_DN4287_c0_g3_i1:144-989(+)